MKISLEALQPNKINVQTSPLDWLLKVLMSYFPLKKV